MLLVIEYVSPSPQDYTLSQTTLNDVFLRFVYEQSDEDANANVVVIPSQRPSHEVPVNLPDIVTDTQEQSVFT